MEAACNRQGGSATCRRSEDLTVYKRIDHVGLHVADLERSVAFYDRHFWLGFKKYVQQTVTGGPRTAYLRLGDTVRELAHRPEGAMTGFHFCLETDTFDVAVSALQAAGVPIAPPIPRPQENRSSCADDLNRDICAAQAPRDHRDHPGYG